MKEQKKAKELVNTFIDLNHKYSFESGQHYGMPYEYHKKCAITVVEEILMSLPPNFSAPGFGAAQFENPDKDFWHKVKSEIEKL